MTRLDAPLGMIDSILGEISRMPSFNTEQLNAVMDAVKKIADIINEMDVLDLDEEVAGITSDIREVPDIETEAAKTYTVELTGDELDFLKECAENEAM